MLTILNWQTRTVPPMPQPALRLHISVRVELKSKATAVDRCFLLAPSLFYSENTSVHRKGV